MIKDLHVHGFKTLVDTSIDFEPLTILLGKNGVGKTAILESLQVLSNFARGGISRAFGPPPWSLDWLRTQGVGTVPNVRFDVTIETVTGGSFKYSVSLGEHQQQAQVMEERLIQKEEQRIIASLGNSSSANGTILKPDAGGLSYEVQAVSEALRAIAGYELNPEVIENGVDTEHTYVGRDGYGVAGFLAHLKDEDPKRFTRLESRLKTIRPETQSIDVWSSGGRVFWGLRDPGQEKAFQAVHLSWGDRQLVGLLCVLYTVRPAGAIVAIEEIDRGLHYSRYLEILELLSEAAYDGLDEDPPIQIIVTTHSPSFVNKLQDRIGEMRSVMRLPEGTIVKSVGELLKAKLGTTELNRPVGEIWEMGLFEEPPKIPAS